MKRISFLLVFLAALGLAFGACGKDDDKKKSDDEKENKKPTDEGGEDGEEATDDGEEATDDGEEATDDGEEATDDGEEAAAGEFGVPECDEYMEKMMACLDKLPEQAQTAAKTAWEQSQEAWKEAASTDEGKKALAQTCKTAMEAAASSYKAMGCEF